MILTIDQLKQIASAGGGFVIDASTNRQGRKWFSAGPPHSV